MTNKINGIDVSECEFYNDCECDAYRHEYWEPQDNTKDMCKEHEDCYFKHLKRLQEENEGLKSLNDFNVQKIEVLQEENEKLYKALEEIRNYASVLYGEPLIDGSKIRLKSGMYRIKTKINEVLNDRN